MYNLLIADDEALIRKGLRSIDWSKIGVRILADVGNGLDAIELIQSEMVDVVLTDIRMPGMDGLDLARFVFEQSMYTAVILLSGYDDFEYARSAIQYGVREYILKPSSPEEIIASVLSACEHIGIRKEKDMRLRLMEAELGKRQLVLDNDGYVLGEFENSDLSRKILGFIAEHYRQAISLSTLSQAFHFSTTYLSKILKRSTGYTFLDILNAMRVHKAARLLREGETSFSTLCANVGIEDPRYFSQVFKKYFGVTPSAYRKAPIEPTDIKLAYLVRSVRGEKP